MASTAELRGKFLDYFKKQGHTVVPSDSLIPSGDPTLLFTSAGMVQFKKHFLGQIRLDFRRAASCQKCLRTSDIDRVGMTARHLTFFEMLGNFSFGDYFKQDAIHWGWEFLTKEAGLDPKRLYPTVYKEDDEAVGMWKKIVPENRIIRLGEDSNFWNMGPTGPCGPCSEILLDRGEQYGHPGCPGPGCDCDRYMEVWNLVFTQFDRQADGTLQPLPQKNIDTGMGLERLSVAANGLGSSFEIDLFRNLVEGIRQSIGRQDISEKSLRIVSDHMRSSTFLISDGVLPSNEGRGYVLRRLLRRALRQGWMHGKKEPFLHRLVSVVSKDMGSAYPELHERRANIESIIETEEKNALSTIEVGTRTLEEAIADSCDLKAVKPPLGKVTLPGEKVYQIYDTYGLDKEIQKEIVRDWQGELIFSEAEYEKAREKAIETARKGWKGSGEKDVTLYTELQKKIGSVPFRGYEVLELEAKVLAVLRHTPSGLQSASELKAGESGEIILSETPFYAESGGQVGDQGRIENGGFSAAVSDTQKPVEGLIAHSVKVTRGSVKAGDAAKALVDPVLRRHTMRHHTATHLLHAALRKILGTTVTQAGSLVSSEKLRFDFTYPKSVTREQLAEIEREVNGPVLKNIRRERGEYSLDEARKKGALAMFGEKYGDKVFVVKYEGASTEVCGGTHCEATGDIGLFKILAESSVGSGVRRIEAVAGEKALDFVQSQDRAIHSVTEKLKSSWAEAPEKIEKLLQKQAELEKEIGTLKRKSLGSELGDLVSRAKALNGKAKLVVEQIAGLDASSLRETADLVRDKLGSGVVLLTSGDGEKISFVVTVTPDLQKEGFHAGKIAKGFAQMVQGSGGGKESFAQGGGKAVGDLDGILKGFSEKILSLK
jgi:alanyl-tRNA synthetase